MGFSLKKNGMNLHTGYNKSPQIKVFISTNIIKMVCLCISPYSITTTYLTTLKPSDILKMIPKIVPNSPHAFWCLQQSTFDSNPRGALNSALYISTKSRIDTLFYPNFGCKPTLKSLRHVLYDWRQLSYILDRG